MSRAERRSGNILCFIFILVRSNLFCLSLSLLDTPSILLGIQVGGASVIELGIPYTDHQGDGATIQHTNQIAISGHLFIVSLSLELLVLVTHFLMISVSLFNLFALTLISHWQLDLESPMQIWSIELLTLQMELLWGQRFSETWTALVLMHQLKNVQQLWQPRSPYICYSREVNIIKHIYSSGQTIIHHFIISTIK